MIESKNITKRYGDFTAVEDVSFRVEPGSIYGLIGYNGAGKTTLLKTLAGIYRPEEGTAMLGGEDSFNSNKVRDRLFFVPDDLYFLPGATMRGMAKFYEGYYPRFSMKTFEKLSSFFGLDTKKRVRAFSKGMQRQAELVFALASHPKYILLDEAFDGLDPAKRISVKKLFIEYAAESGCSILISSHNLPEIAELCDHVGIINGKSLIVNTSVDDVSRDYRKYRILFNGEVDKLLFEGIAYKQMSIENQLAVFTARGDIKEINGRIAAMQPVSVDEVMLSLEEVFMYEMEDKEHDISEIFN
ncbi:MAG: ABC transporter ATP-binding protein [Oscillospiraceae bacterium]|jgi:ABC-2 type transport system ATP-binding protein|nr:ABC transporter ATP-binding protein [Oscillospiraceae bacterium]